MGLRSDSNTSFLEFGVMSDTLLISVDKRAFSEIIELMSQDMIIFYPFYKHTPSQNKEERFRLAKRSDSSDSAKNPDLDAFCGRE